MPDELDVAVDDWPVEELDAGEPVDEVDAGDPVDFEEVDVVIPPAAPPVPVSSPHANKSAPAAIVYAHPNLRIRPP
jgi:hypothetical protein